MEKDLNCSLRRLMTDPILGTCNDTKFGSSKDDMLSRLNRLDERQIFEMTGCMPGCSKSKIELATIDEDNMIDDGKNVAKLRFVYPRGEYDLVEEYYIYNWGSFIADVGGYLGLLLGYSALSMYHIITPLLIKQVKWLAKKSAETHTESC